MRPGDTLLIGVGNPARGDDGLGPALARRIARQVLPAVAVEIDYQLSVDHALPISQAGCVVFADAALDAGAPYRFGPVDPAGPAALGSHSVTPEAAVALARLLFGRAPPAFVLGLSGTAFGAIAEGLSAAAERNLGLAEAFLLRWLETEGRDRR